MNNNRNRTWICNNCKRVYPHSLNYCPKCNLSKKHSIRFVETFINSENKLNTIKAKNNRTIEMRKRKQKRLKK